jgi:signal transduction histidine kinase
LKPIRGSGIGLALVQHIARAHGGDVSVDSRPDHGATFKIWLPIK